MRTPALADTVVVEIDVGNENRAPVLTVPSDTQVVNEGDSLGFGVSANDPDGDSIILSAEGMPSGAAFVDNGDGTGSFSWEPGYCDSGVYEVRFIARDVGSPVMADTDYVEIEVVEVDRAPEVSDPGLQSVAEGDTLEFNVVCSDPDSCDSDMVYLVAEDLPSGASFVSDTGNPATGTFSWVPGYDQSGVYYVRFIGYDMRTPALADTVVVEIDVGESGNHAPVFDSLVDQTVSEGETLVVHIMAHDPDGDSVTMMWYYPTLEGATFVDSGNGVGSFTYVPDYYSAGVKNVTFYARDDRDPPLTGRGDMAITVIDVNQPPVIDSIGDKMVYEGDTLVIHVHATDPTDPDGGPLYLSVTSIPPNASFTDNGDGTGDFVFAPDYNQAGVYNITFVCADADTPQFSDYEQVKITVIDVDRAPVLDSIGFYVLNEGDTLVDTITAYDPDGDSIVLSVDTLPENASFQDLSNDTGIFFFAPAYWQAGIYTITFTASDGKLSDFEVVPIQVLEAGNHAPVLDSIGPQNVMEGETLQFTVHAFDPDSDSLVLVAEDLPENASFVDNGDGSGDFLFTPNYVQSGSYLVTFIATDLDSADTEVVTITVQESGDHPPVINVPSDTQYVRESDTLTFDVSATDVEGDSIFFTVESAPANSEYEDHGDGTMTFSFYPDYFQAGVYDVIFIATDDSLLSDTGVVTIVVNNVDRKPEIDSIPTQHTNEGDTLILSITAHDPDNDSIWLWIYPTIPNMSFTDNGDGTATFFYAPDYNAAGIHGFWVYASDGELNDTTFFSVLVYNTNRPPVLDSIGPKSVVEGETLTFNVTAHDPDGTRLNLYATPLPDNASFQDLGNDTGVFFFTPDYTQSGMYNVYFIADDGGLADSELVVITVFDAGNQRPYLDSIPPQTVDEGDTLEVLVVAHDPDGVPPHLESGPLPDNSSFADNGDGTGTFLFIPACDQAGSYSVYFVAIDSDDSTFQDTVTLSITVNDVNHFPVLELSADSFAVTYGDTVQIVLYAHDPEAREGCDSLVFEILQSPGGSLSSVDETTAVYTWAVDKGHIGPHFAIFSVNDGNGGIDTAVAMIRSRGFKASKPEKIVVEKDSLRFVFLFLPDTGTYFLTGFYVENISATNRALRILSVKKALSHNYFDESYEDITAEFSYGMDQIIGFAPSEKSITFWASTPIDYSSGFSLKVETEVYSVSSGWARESYQLELSGFHVDPGDSISMSIPLWSNSIILVNAYASGPDSWDVSVNPDTFFILPPDTVYLYLNSFIPDTASHGGTIELTLVDRTYNDTIVLEREFILDGFSTPGISFTDSIKMVALSLEGDVNIPSGNVLSVDNSVVMVRNSSTLIDINDGGQAQLTEASFKGAPAYYDFNIKGTLRSEVLEIDHLYGLRIENADTIDIAGLVISDFHTEGLRIVGEPPSLEMHDIFIGSGIGNALILDTVNSLVIRNLNIETAASDAVILNSSNLTVVDGSVDSSQISLNGNATFDYSHSLYLTVLSVDSTFIESVEVRLYDRHGTPVYEGYTDDTYTLGPIELPVYRKSTVSGDEVYTPYSLVLSYWGIDTTLEVTFETPTYLTVVMSGKAFIRGDVNADGSVNVTDVVWLLNNMMPPTYLCDDAADCNDDGHVNLTDAVFALQHITPPTFPEPNLECGPDPTPDNLDCESFPPCGGKQTLADPGSEKNDLSGSRVIFRRAKAKGDTLVYFVELHNYVDILGLQFTIEYDREGLKLLGIDEYAPAASDVDYVNYEVDSLDGKIYAVLLHSVSPRPFRNPDDVWKPGVSKLVIVRMLQKMRRSRDPELIYAVLADPEGYSIEYNHTSIVSGVLGREEGKVKEFLNCYPSLVGKTVEIRFGIPEASRAKLEIFDKTGRKVKTIVDGYFDKGVYSITWRGEDERGRKVAKGVYFVKLTREDEKYLVTKVIKM